MRVIFWIELSLLLVRGILIITTSAYLDKHNVVVKLLHGLLKAYRAREVSDMVKRRRGGCSGQRSALLCE